MLVDPVSLLIAVDLSDGSALTVTASHPVYVDKGQGLSAAGWLEAGQLRMGDYVRTASGVDVVVAGLRWGAGRALVYTLTVAKDHTFWGESGGDHDFFVGTARVLVHNADGPCDLTYEGSPKHHENAGPGIGDAPTNGQAALSNSVQVKDTSPRRVGVDPETGQIVIFDQTMAGTFHGHVRAWGELRPEQQNALVKAWLTDRKGRPIK